MEGSYTYSLKSGRDHVGVRSLLFSTMDIHRYKVPSEYTKKFLQVLYVVTTIWVCAKDFDLSGNKIDDSNGLRLYEATKHCPPSCRLWLDMMKSMTRRMSGVMHDV